jgi:hypothetical protein
MLYLFLVRLDEQQGRALAAFAMEQFFFLEFFRLSIQCVQIIAVAVAREDQNSSFRAMSRRNPLIRMYV